VAAEVQTLPALLARNAAVDRDKPAVVADGNSITYAELDHASSKLAARLIAAGVGKSSRVGILMPNSMDWVLSAAAAARVGACLVPLSTLVRPPELLAQLQTATVTHLITTREFRGRRYLEEPDETAQAVAAITSATGRHPVLPALRKVWSFEDLPGPEVDLELVAALGGVVRPADDLAILFTSGSRGAPKGVIHTHGSSIRATAAGLACGCVGAEQPLHIEMPFFWTSGFLGGLMTALVAGATLLTGAVPEPEKALSGPRSGSTAGANLCSLTESFGPYSGEGLATGLPPSKRGSCGRPLEGIEVRIVDSDTRIEVPPGTVGEIRLRGPNMMRAICGRLGEETFDVDGFYPTGDLGSLDTDGYLWLHGRLDDTFEVNGRASR
jgi:acyl-CoA synthetase (AMP-forming)/AMP-acid ligase II